MPPVTIGFATSGGVRQLCCTGCLGDSMAFGLAVEDFGAKPFAEIATGATPPVCTAAKPTSGLSREKHSTCLAKAGAVCGIPLSVLSLVTGLAISLHGNSRLAASACLNSRNTLLLKHLVIMCNHGLHSAFLWAVGCPMACLAADVAVPRESTTMILLRATRATLALETGRFLAILLRLLPASALALALALLVPHLLLGAAWLARPAVATALTARRLPARTSSHTAQQLAKLCATW